MGARTAQEKPDSAGVADHHRADLQQCQPQGIGACCSQSSVPERPAPQSFEQRIRQARQQLPELIGPPAVTGGATREQVELLILDPVLHVAAGTVELVVQVSIRLRKVGHHKAWVGTQATVLGLHDHPSRLVPAEGAIANRGEQTLLLAGQVIQRFGHADPQGCLSFDPGILGQPDDVAYIVPLTPAQNLPAAEAAVAAEDDLHLRPVAAQRFDQQRQDRPGMPCRIAVAAAQIAHQQVATTENIQRQEAIVIVIAVEETPLLVAMQRCVRGVEVQDQSAGRLVVRFDKLLEQHLVDGDSGLATGTVLQTAQG